MITKFLCCILGNHNFILITPIYKKAISKCINDNIKKREHDIIPHYTTQRPYKPCTMTIIVSTWKIHLPTDKKQILFT